MRRAALTLLLIAAGWLGMAAGAALMGSSETVAVPASRPGLLTRLPPGATLAGSRGDMLLFRGKDGLALDLYRAGALLVLPARGGTCLDLR